MSECVSFSRIMQSSSGELALSVAEQEHLQQCPECRRHLRLAGDDRELELQLRAAEQDIRRFAATPMPVLGDYQLLQEIGRGGMGVIYEAIQRSLNRRVALKILPTLLTSLRPDSGPRFRSEAAAAARLRHPNIVPIHDYGYHGGCHYYAMELIRGYSLDQIIRTYGAARQAGGAVNGTAAPPSLPPVGPAPIAAVVPQLGPPEQFKPDADYFQTAAGWIAEVADALQCAHDQNVIHRDIKPSNLILCESGRLMITDFGLAKDLSDTAATRTEQVMGTWQYMSPEQVRDGGQSVDHRSDIYSLGITLYELLTFRPAVDGGPDHEIARRLLEQEPPAPRRIMPQVPRDLATICQKAIRKQPAARYATAADLAADLRRYLNDQPIQARPPRWSGRVIRTLRRNRPGVVLVLAAALLVTSVVSTAAYLELARERAELQDATTAKLVTNANNLMQKGQFNSAINQYTMALTRDPGLAYVYSARAVALWELGRLDEAVADLGCAIELSPQRPGAYLWRGVVHLLQGRSAEAIADVHTALRLRPAYEEALLFASVCAGMPSSVDGSAGGDVEGMFRAALAAFLAGRGDVQDLAARVTSPRQQALLHLAAAERARAAGDLNQALSQYRSSVAAHDVPGVMRLYCRSQLALLGP